MTVHLKPDQERVVGQAIQAGLIASAEEVVDAGVEAIRKRLEAAPVLETSMSPEEWVREFDSWVRSHPTNTSLLSDEAVSRESIYGTRGQ